MITIVNLKTNVTGQVADHIGMDNELLEAMGYARIEIPVIPEFESKASSSCGEVEIRPIGFSLPTKRRGRKRIQNIK